FFVVLVSTSLISGPRLLADERALEFHITYDRKIGTESFTGRVYVILDSENAEDLPEEIDWFKPQPLLAVDVKNWKPGDRVVVGKDALAHPPFEKIPAKSYTIHAVMDFDRGSMFFTTADGNGYSKPALHRIDPTRSGAINITIDQVYKNKAFEETDSK